ncbi:MAG TPA: ABC transporter permease [Phototrophicaceae bacterium]|jgi:ribose transport system permease protein|nr:ABC transporter permease [Phototrophicaceae bacterium]
MIATMKANQSTPSLWRFVFRNFRVGIAYIILIALLGITASLNERFFTPPVITSTSNQSMTLIFAGMAQTSVVITGGIDLSVGPVISMSNSLASATFLESNGLFNIVLVVLLVLTIASIAGLINGLIVVYGRLQPIIVTLATSSIYSGVALYLRPRPGGYVPDIYGDLLTKRVGQLLPETLFGSTPTGLSAFLQSFFNFIPASTILLIIVLVLIWIPFQRSRLGMWVYAVGSNEGAAYMSGVNVKQAKVFAYTLGGFFAGIAGLFLTAQTRSGDATTGAVFTLQSIAVVVLGGTSLFGGSGGVAGTIAGAIALRLIPTILFFARVNPLQQPLWEGGVILLAVAAGASRIFTVRNRLDTMR